MGLEAVTCLLLPAPSHLPSCPVHTAEYAALLGELHKIHTKPGRLLLTHECVREVALLVCLCGQLEASCTLPHTPSLARPAAVRMMIQDLTPANLLVDDGPEGIRLLLADPAMAQPIELLQEKGRWVADCLSTVASSCRQTKGPVPHTRSACAWLMAHCLPTTHFPWPSEAIPLHQTARRRSALCGTWLWGSMRVRRHQFDPKADLYSLSFSFAEVGRGSELHLVESHCERLLRAT